MNITLNNISKRYKREWIFKSISLELKTGDHCVILGANGSGKSTLLKIISGAMLPSDGNISYYNNEAKSPISSEKIHKHISIAAPYMELIEDYTLTEHIEFHFHFKKLLPNIKPSEIPDLIGLEHASDKQLKYFSSGMKQRVKLGLAILSDTSLLLLDEPCSNLDQKGIDWYKQLISKHTLNRTTLVCSNHLVYEYPFFEKQLLVDKNN